MVRLKNPQLWIGLAVLATAVLIAACGGGGGDTDSSTPPPQTERSSAEKMLAAQGGVMQVAVTAFQARCEELDSAVQALVATPDGDRLDTVKARFTGAVLAWQHLESFYFGPAREERLGRQLHFWPTRPNTIQRTLADWETVSQQDFTEFGVAGKGFPAMEYLLYAAPELDLTAAEAGHARAYLAAVSGDLVRVAGLIDAIWSEDGGRFHAEFVNAHAGTTLYPTLREALSALVNQLAFQLETIKNTKIGKPMGRDSGGEPRPETVEAPYSGASLAYVQANLEMIQWLYLGDTGSGVGFGLHEYLAERDQELADEIVTVFEQTAASLTALRQTNDDLASAVTQNPDDVAAFNAQMQNLVLKVKVELATTLGLTITFNDNDGD